MRRFIKDARGAGNPIEFALILPLLLLLLLGIYEVWKIIALKESLDRGVLQAAEYWSTCPPTPSPQPYKETAEEIIRREVAANPILRAQAEEGRLPSVDLSVKYYDAKTSVELWDPAWLSPPFEPFIIVARLAVPWAIRLPLLSSRWLVISSQHATFKEKPLYRIPTPTPVRR